MSENLVVLLLAHQADTVGFYIADTIEGLDSNLAYFTHREGAPQYRPELFSCDVPATGRYVKVIMDKDDTGLFCFSELEVYGQPLESTTTSPSTTT